MPLPDRRPGDKLVFDPYEHKLNQVTLACSYDDYAWCVSSRSEIARRHALGRGSDPVLTVAVKGRRGHRLLRALLLRIAAQRGWLAVLDRVHLRGVVGGGRLQLLYQHRVGAVARKTKGALCLFS